MLLKVNVYRKGAVIFAEILEQSSLIQKSTKALKIYEDFNNTGIIVSFWSIQFPQLEMSTVGRRITFTLRGTNTICDSRLLQQTFNSIEEAMDYEFILNKAIK